jgi:hypothetical protein
VRVSSFASKDKILRPNGWSMEFYLEFFEFLSDELLSGGGGKNFRRMKIA